VENAGHGRYVPGPPTSAIAVLTQVAVAVQSFLDAIDWPA
jgi:hypothetical protein